MDAEQHAAQRARGRDLAQEIAGTVVARDREARWDGALLRRLGAAGLLAAGDAATPAAALCAALTGLGEGCGDGGLALAWGAHTLGCAVPIARLGSEAQRRRHLPGLHRGEQVGAWAHREAAVAGERTGVTTRARRRPGGWTLTGRKTWVVNGPVADVLIVTAVTDPSRGAAGVSSFIVERDAPGLAFGPRVASAGARTAEIAELVLDGCELGEHGLLADEGAGLTRTLRLVQRWERGCMLAPWLGILRAALARTVDFVGGALQFGEPLARSQAVRARLADMRIRLELCERLQARSAAQLDQGDEAGERELAAARLFIGAALAEVARDAASICGPEAQALGHPLERLARDLPLAGLLGVSDDLLRSIVAGALLGLG